MRKLRRVYAGRYKCVFGGDTAWNPGQRRGEGRIRCEDRSGKRVHVGAAYRVLGQKDQLRAHDLPSGPAASWGQRRFLEYGGVRQRYTAPMMRTAVIGEPSPEVLCVAEAVKDTVSTPKIDGVASRDAWATSWRWLASVFQAVTAQSRRDRCVLWGELTVTTSDSQGRPPTWSG